MTQRYDDPALQRVAEFHDAFNCAHNRVPGMPAISDGDAHQVTSVGHMLLAMSRQLKAQAAEANDTGRPGLGLILVRLQLAVEEVGELAEAIGERNVTAILDALTDIGYVNNGSYLTFGLGDLKAAAEREVHRSNMSKLGRGGKPLIHPSGRVLKGPDYTQPDLQSLIDAHPAFAEAAE